MRKILFSIIILSISLMLFNACQGDSRDVLDTSGNVDIQAFVINGVKGVINPGNATISVILPSGTDLNNLSPQITLADGAQVSPSSGQSVSFVDGRGMPVPLTYTVKDKDLYQKYKVNVDVARAIITSFKIGAVDADIDETNKKIVIYLPVGTNVTALYPTVEYTEGATLSPASGSSVDFTNPVNFTLEYLGSTFTYEVTVILGEKPKPIIVIYNGENVSPIWASIASTINNGYINPKTNGINPTPNCISILRKKEATDDGGRPWSGGALWNENKVNIDPAVYGSFTLMVLKQNAGNVQLEIQSDGEQNKDWLKATYSDTALGEWQKLTFVIPAGRTAVINNILVAPHEADTNNDPNFTTQMMYWDELQAHPK